MQVSIRSSSATAVTTGILLLTHAKRLGHPIEVSLEGNPDEAARVDGPAMVYSPVLSGCGVGKVPGSNALVCVAGTAVAPLLVSLEHGGLTDWFSVDRQGVGEHGATQDIVELCRSQNADAQNLGRVLRGALAALGCPAEPALLDLLFGAPVPPLERVAIAIRAGRVMTGGGRDLFTQFIQHGAESYPDPLPSPLTPDALVRARETGHLDALLARLSDGIAEAVVDWLNGIEGLATAADFSRLTCAVAEVGSHLVSVPLTGMLPTLSGPKDGLAIHLGHALGAMEGESCAMKTLIGTFRFLGGKFVEHAAFAVDLPGEPPPEGRIERWEWLCRSAYAAKDEAEGLWQRLIDPVQ